MIPLVFRNVDSSNWSDLERLFESRGGPHNCWCMVWRKMDKVKSKAGKSDRKEALKGFVTDNLPIGILAYNHSDPVAWCSVAPRETYSNLSGDNSLDKVWSIVCFFIKKEFRKQNLTEELIRQALKYAKENGAKYVEAYPVDEDSPSYRFMGFRPVFERMGFEFRHKAGQRRNVMVITL